jgi:hypothetical protein
MMPSNAVPTLADVAPAVEHHLAAALAALTQDADVLAVTRDWRDLIGASEVRSVAADLIVQALAELARLDAFLKSPARRDHDVGPWASAVATTGGPVQPPAGEAGKEPTPGSAAAFPSVARGSAGGAAHAPGAGADFSLPAPRRPRPFEPGRFAARAAWRLLDRARLPPPGVGVQYDAPPRDHGHGPVPDEPPWPGTPPNPNPRPPGPLNP